MLLEAVEVHTDISYIGLKSLEQAETLWHKNVQSRQLADIEFLRQLKGNYLHNFEGRMMWRAQKFVVPSICLDLQLSLIHEGIISIQTSLASCPNLSFDLICFILLPSKCPFVYLVFAHIHINVSYTSIHFTRSKLIFRFLLPKLTPVVESILYIQIFFDQKSHNHCVPNGPDLLYFSFIATNHWLVALLEMTCHYCIKDRHGNAEISFFLAEVPQTGSGLVEIALHAFVQVSAISYGRFYSKNGVPDKINFDQGSNFKAFDDNLTVISEVITKNRFFSYKGVFWDQSPTTRSITTPNFNDWVFIKDKFIDLGLVKIIEQIDSINGELRKTDLELNTCSFRTCTSCH